MQIKSEKGFAATDIAIAIVVLFIFVSLIAILAYSFNSTTKEIELKSQATTIAVNEIEKMKNKTIEELEKEDKSYRQSTEVQEGFFRQIEVIDYADEKPDKIPGFVKKVTVKIQYKFKQQTQTVELSTIVSKEI